MNRFQAGFLILVCAVYSLIAGLYPFEFSDRIQAGVAKAFVTAIAPTLEQLSARDFLINIVYFLPWGFVAYLWFGSRPARTSSALLGAALLGGIVSVGIELTQVFFHRHPSIFDIIANTVGAVLGAVFCVHNPIDIRAIAARMSASAQRSRVLVAIVVLVGAVPSIATVARSGWFDFGNWDRSFTLQLGNEATLNRPWLGVIYLAAIYNRALSPAEVGLYYELGASQDSLAGRRSKHLIALYTFHEGHGSEVHDVSGYGAPLNLRLEPSCLFRWLEDRNGIEIVGPAILKSEGPAEKLFDTLSASNELSIEAWLTPSDALQNGPARIVSFSGGSGARNFTLGQEGSEIDFRLRTPAAGRNGMPVALRTRDGSLGAETSHIVATYRDGHKNLYVNGQRYPADLNLREAVILAFGARKHALAQIAYILVYFFPVSFFLAFYSSSQRHGLAGKQIVPALAAVALLGLAEILQANIFARPIDLPLLAYGAFIGSAGAFSGATFASCAQRWNVRRV